MPRKHQSVQPLLILWMSSRRVLVSVLLLEQGGENRSFLHQASENEHKQCLIFRISWFEGEIGLTTETWMGAAAADLLYCPCSALSPLHNLPRLVSMSVRAAG